MKAMYRLLVVRLFSNIRLVKELGSLCSPIFFPFFLDAKPGLRLGSQIGGLVICKK